ncbi:MAG: DeoR family transcriptional regulator, partial [Oscillospiraceae bacterium]
MKDFSQCVKKELALLHFSCYTLFRTIQNRSRGDVCCMERTDRIMDLLSTHKKMSTQQLCQALFCSPSSLRRDLRDLEKTGSVRRVRG